MILPTRLGNGARRMFCLFVCLSVCLSVRTFQTINRMDDESCRLRALYKNLIRVRMSKVKLGHSGPKTAFWLGVVL